MVERVKAWTEDGDELHPQEDINQVILSMAKQMAKGAALDEWNRTHVPSSSPPSAVATSVSGSILSGHRSSSAQTQDDKDWNPQQCILAYEMAQTLFLTLLEPVPPEDPAPGLNATEVSAVEKCMYDLLLWGNSVMVLTRCSVRCPIYWQATHFVTATVWWANDTVNDAPHP